jgi:hypothetical protein
MTTENFDLKVNDVVVGNTGMGENMGYYIETKTDKKGIWVYYGSSKNTTRGVYVRPIVDVRLATKEEVAEFEA